MHYPSPSLVYTNTITGLCPNNPAQVDAWVLNLMKRSGCNGNAIDPNLTFQVTDISGNIIAQKNTGDITESPVITWNEQSFLFNVPANGDVILKIISNASRGCGNDFAIDDISFRSCGPAIFSSFTNTSSTQLAICESSQSNLKLSASYNGAYANPVFQWQVSTTQGDRWMDIPGANGASYTRTPTAPGDYLYRCEVTDAGAGKSCLFASNFLTVDIIGRPFAQATNYVYGCYGSTVYLTAAGGSTYEWFGPNGFHTNLQRAEIPHVDFSNTGLYTVKVTTAPGCFDYDTTTLTIYAAPIATLTPRSVHICEGDSVQLNAGGSLRYEWSPSNGLSNDTIPDPFVKPVNNTTYTVRVYNAYTCFDTASVNIFVWKKPKAYAGPDKFFRKGKPVQLHGTATGTDISYSWSPASYLDNPNYLNPVARPPGSIIYTLTVASNDGCGVSTDDVELEVIDKFFIPTAFTPNNDGLNDLWEIITFEDYEEATVKVFNRYGQIVYQGFGKNYKPWDGNFKGQPALPGVYVYLINLHNGKPLLKGVLTLIR